MKRAILFFVSLVALSPGVRAQDSGFGAGVILGEPTGLSGKLWVSRQNAIDMGLAYSFRGKGYFHIHADYLWHFPDVIQSTERFPLYVGIGGRIAAGRGGIFGVRIPLGIAYWARSAPIEVFLEAVPVLDLAPATESAGTEGSGPGFTSSSCSVNDHQLHQTSQEAIVRPVFCGSLLAVSLLAQAMAAVPYDRFFGDNTMRVDYFHTGTKGEDRITIDQVYQEGKWAGTRTNLIDEINLGEYGVRVYDRATNALIFSQGFSSIFNEWQTTDEALAGIYRTFSETVRFPYPRKPVQLSLVRRDKQMVYHEVFTTVIDPNSATEVSKERRSSSFKVTPILENGSPSTEVDIAILGDGYAKGDMEKLRADARHFNDVMFSTEPFKSRKREFNVWLVEVESKESGIDVPDKDIWKGNALGFQYNTFNTPRYVLTTDNKAVRDAAGAAPYDAICVLINDTRYGGGGIYNLYATTYTKEEAKDQKWQMDYMYVHEFGHSFAGLADEYYSAQTGYNDFYSPGIEPWEPNITALLDKKNIKWNEYLTKGIELPTPWEKTQYDSISAIQSKLDRLAPDYYEKREPLFRALVELRNKSKYEGKVGAFEGAGYASKGLYRPSVDCRMFSLSLTGFDPVCNAELNRVIDYYVK